MRKLSLFVCTVLILVAAGCGGGETEGPAIGGGGDAGGAATPAGPPVEATATLSGRILFEGTPPAAQRIQMSADPRCPQGGGAVQEEVKVSDGGLENVMVYISSGLEGKTFPAATQEVVIDQNGCIYHPRVITMQVKQPLKIRNSDPTLHNIHAWAEKNRPFNDPQARQGMEFTRTFDTEGIVPIKCDVHSWMQAFVGVFNHPFHTVSAQGGNYEMKLPAGTYQITAWHELYGAQTQMVEVTDGGSAQLNFTFKAS